MVNNVLNKWKILNGYITIKHLCLSIAIGNGLNVRIRVKYNKFFINSDSSIESNCKSGFIYYTPP